MTSKSSSWTNMQKVMFKQRSWVFAVSFLTYAVLHIALPTMILSNRRHNWQMYQDAGTTLTLEETMRQSALSIYARRSVLLMEALPVIALAALLAFQGFAWLNNRRQIDFYESQPISRNKHFLQVVLSSFLMFVISYLVTLGIGGLIVTGMGAYSHELLVESLKLFVKTLFLFAGYFGVTSLAIMLTGNTVVGFLAAAVFCLYEAMFSGMLTSLRQMYYHTFPVSGDIGPVWTAPIYWAFSQAKHHWVKGLVLLILVYAGTFACYKIRRNEDAGEAVLYKPVRIAAKVAVSLLMGLFVSVIFCRMADNSQLSSVIAGVIAAVVTGCIMESIYAFDVRAAIRGFGWTLMGAAAAAALFVIIAWDLTGYDSWVPDPEKVEDAYLVDSHYDYRSTGGGYTEKYMHLTDIEAVNELLKIGEAFARGEYAQEEAVQGDNYNVFQLELHYRMKNGKDIARSIQVSNVTDRELMDRIIGSDSFREGYFLIYHNEFLEEHMDKLRINASLVNSEGKDVPAQKWYSELKAAYEQDLQQFNWTMACDSRIIGEFSFTPMDRYEKELDDMFCPEFVVYETFGNTIAVLQKAGLYPEKIDVDQDTGYGCWIMGPFGVDSGYYED